MLRRYILGDTDSEVFFYLMLSHMSNDLGVVGKTLHQRGVEPGEITAAVARAIREVKEVTGLACYAQSEEGAPRLLLSFVLTNGELLLAHQGSKELFFSTHKVCCAERDVCPSFGVSCESESASIWSSTTWWSRARRCMARTSGRRCVPARSWAWTRV